MPPTTLVHMEKPVFLAILDQIVLGFEEPAFRTQYTTAKAAGNVPQLMELTLGVQHRAFADHGLDAVTGSVRFKEAGREFGLDGDVALRLARMKAALAA